MRTATLAASVTGQRCNQLNYVPNLFSYLYREPACLVAFLRFSRFEGLPHDEAVRRLLASSSKQFDADVVQIFIPVAEQEISQVFAAAGTSTAAVL
jgi:hypothetical protein